MTGKDGDIAADSNFDSNLKEQDKGIIEAFAKEDHKVLTNSEIADNISLSKRQVRRRLDALAEKGVIGKRVVSGVKLAWIKEDVKEPITVRYPLLRYVRNRTSVQLFLLGVAGGIVSVIILLAAAISIGYEVSIGFTSPEQLLVYGVVAATFSALFIIVSISMAVLERLLRYAGFDLESRFEELRE